MQGALRGCVALMRRRSAGLTPLAGAAATQVRSTARVGLAQLCFLRLSSTNAAHCLMLISRRDKALLRTDVIFYPQVMQRFADSVRVQTMVQSERSLCYTLLLHALEVRNAAHIARRLFLHTCANHSSTDWVAGIGMGQASHRTAM